MSDTFEVDFGGRPLKVETGKVAKQAHGAIWGQWGDTIVLASVVYGPNMRNTDFFPLMVDYRDKMYAGGRIPGSFFRREGRPSDHEVLKCRLIDRPLRPMFPKGFMDEVQIYLNTYSVDLENPDGLVAMNAASLALMISEIPFSTPVSAVQVGMIDDKLVLNPTIPQMADSRLDLIVAGTAEAITMVEAGAKELPEDTMLEALELAHDNIKRLCAFQEEVREAIGKPKIDFVPPDEDEHLINKVADLAHKHLTPVYDVHEKEAKDEALNEARQAVQDDMMEELEEDVYEEQAHQILSTFDSVYKKNVRQSTLEGKRSDGRGLKDVRPITVDVGLIPRAHGSAIFTRGQTQSMGVCTLGTKEDQFLVDDIRGKFDKAYYLHYNFPAWCVGEVRPPRGPGRREIGHGHLAERSIEPILPDRETFPYTIRLVSEILESNGSSSMASVCSCCLSMMDCGVPIKAPVAGIAMGLIKEGDDVAVLSDINGAEDHLGDMDFKVAGTRDGITALQMDIKITGVTRDIMRDALYQAKEGRLFILDRMGEALPEAREELSRWAPRITLIKISPEKISTLIGPGGKTIKGIVEETGVKIDVEDDGSVFIATSDADAADKAQLIVEELTALAELNKIYTGKVVRVTDFGVFVEFMRGQDGLLHISEMTEGRLGTAYDLCQEGDTLTVKVIGIDESNGKVRLSRKAALQDLGELPDEVLNPNPEAAKKLGADGGRGGGRGGRGGSGGGGGRGRPDRGRRR